MSIFELYIITTLLPNLGGFATVSSLILGVVTIVPTAVCLGEGDVAPIKSMIPVYIITVLLIFVAVITPSKKDLVTIVGLNYITTNEQINKLPENSAKVLNKLLEDFITTDTKETK